jgi:hypothetical protein
LQVAGFQLAPPPHLFVQSIHFIWLSFGLGLQSIPSKWLIRKVFKTNNLWWEKGKPRISRGFSLPSSILADLENYSATCKLLALLQISGFGA